MQLAPPEQTTVLPPESVFDVPENWRHSRRHMERVVLAGIGPTPSKLMFVTSSVLDEDTIEQELGAATGRSFVRPPALLKGPHGQALKDICVSVGISMSADVYFTALCKWLLPQDKRLNPKAGDIGPGVRCFEREMAEVKPDIVVVFGKAAFEFMVPCRIKFGDAIGAWFWSERFMCRVMPMSHYYYIAAKPEWTERFRTDFAQVRMELASLNGVHVAKVPLHYRTISNSDELRDLMSEISQHLVWSVDCEWHGTNHIDGELRSLQIAWLPGHAAYIRFRDEKRRYVFDVSYEEAGAIIAPVWNRPELKAVGHHIAADLPWMSHVLGLEWYDKVRLDTEFAYQCCNEHGERGLERMSVRYTDLGRYEMDLEAWKRDHKEDSEGGYGLVPDKIIIPYAMKDVDVPLRAYPYIERDLEQQGMLEYYRGMMNPFISNVFTSFALVGLPLNYQLLDEMRDLYEFARQEIELEFRNSLYEEAWELLAANIIRALPDMRHADTPAVEAYAKLMTPTLVGRLKGQVQAASEGLPLAIPETALLPAVRDAFMSYGLQHADLETACNRVAASVSHVLTAKQFNLRSSAQMKAWLFDVKGYTPVKSTANKEKGIPAMDWAKVMEFRPDRRAGISPAVDKQTLQILAKQHGDDMLQKLLELNAVGNICKAFLKQPIRDENGVITEEAGLPAFIASDGRVHGQFSMTETARPRSWKPNSLNWPSYLQDNVKDGIHRALKMAYKADRLPAKFHEYLEDRKVLSLRSCVQASTGTVFIESDFATAEIRALAFRSGDPKLIDIMTKPDDQFALTKLKSGKGEPLVCRIRFADDCGIDAAHRDPKFLMHVWDENKMLHKVEDSDLLRTPSGALVHPSHDLHWSLVEMVRKVPREVLKKKSDRGAGKVGNFCIAEDEMVLTHLGLVPIQSVLLTHLLWDGIAWVPHEGVVLTGCEVTHTYQGLRATDNHEVWVVKLGKVSFGEARTKGLTLVRSAEGEWVRRCRWVDASEAGYSLEIQDALIQREWPAQVRHEPSKVYDILNAGPRHRFTCSGVLVSNSSAYGATGATLERKIESDTGIKPEPGTGQKILDALTARQPTAAAFLKELEKAPENPGYLRAASGKVRHFVLPPDVYGLSSRMRKSLISAQGREARNFYMQESVAATAMRAGNWLLAFARKHGLVGRAITILYDSVVTWAPIQERAIWSKAHELCMYLANGWYYHERVLRYPIDTELNTGWSLTPGDDPRNKHLAKLIPDMTWAGTPEHLQPLEKWLDSMIDFYRANEFASLDFSGLA